MHFRRRTGSPKRAVAAISALLHVTTNTFFSANCIDPFGSLVSRINEKERIFDSRRIVDSAPRSEIDKEFYVLLCLLTDGIPYLVIDTDPSPESTNMMFTDFINVLESSE